jgi:hypothetical protein
MSRRRAPTRVWVGAGAAVVLSVVAASTSPFTASAEAVVAAGFVPVVVLAVVSRRQHRPTSAGTGTGPPVPGTRPGPGEEEPGRRWGRRWGIWLVPLGGIAAWEVVTYAGSPRAEHPTLSSMLDAVDASHLGHGAAFAAWLVLGCWLVTR